MVGFIKALLIRAKDAAALFALSGGWFAVWDWWGQLGVCNSLDFHIDLSTFSDAGHDSGPQQVDDNGIVSGTCYLPMYLP